MLRNPTDHFLHMINDDFSTPEVKEIGVMVKTIASTRTSSARQGDANKGNEVCFRKGESRDPRSHGGWLGGTRGHMPCMHTGMEASMQVSGRLE